MRRELLSAERFSDAAIFVALACLKTPRFRSIASLSRVTRCDQRFGDVFLDLDVFLDVLVATLRFVWRVAVFRECARFRRSAIGQLRVISAENINHRNQFLVSQRNSGGKKTLSDAAAIMAVAIHA